MSDVSPANGATPLLDVRSLTVYHGQLRAIDDVSLHVNEGEVLAIIGANGAGKSTLLRTIAGLHRPSSGTISFRGEDISRLAAHQRVRRGISLVPEGRRLFASMTLEDNLLVGRARGLSPDDLVDFIESERRK